MRRDDLGDAALDRGPPGRVGRRLGQQALVVGERLGELAVLLLGQRQPEARLDAAGLELQDLLVGRAGLLGDDAVGGEHGGFGKARQPPYGLALEARGAGIGVGGIAKAPELVVDGRDHVPAVAVLGMLAQAGLDLGDEVADLRPLERQLVRVSPRERTAGPASRRRDRAQASAAGRRRRWRAPRRRVANSGWSCRSARRPVELVGARQQAARDLGPGGGGFLVVDQPARPLGLDLLELVAIDGERAGGGGGLGCRAGRASGSSTATRAAAVMTAKAIQRSMRCQYHGRGQTPTRAICSCRRVGRNTGVSRIAPFAGRVHRRRLRRLRTSASAHYAFG